MPEARAKKSSRPLWKLPPMVTASGILFILTLGVRFMSLGSLRVMEFGRVTLMASSGDALLRLFSAEPISGIVQASTGGTLFGFGTYRMEHVTGSSAVASGFSS